LIRVEITGPRWKMGYVLSARLESISILVADYQLPGVPLSKNSGPVINSLLTIPETCRTVT
jgi:hypothetical protein